jgi:hypothetical protein
MRVARRSGSERSAAVGSKGGRSPTGRPTAALACQTHRAERVGVIAVGRSMRVFSLLRRKARARPPCDRTPDEALLKYRSTDSIPLAAARAGFSAATDQQADHACARPRRGGRREPAHPPRASPRGSRHRLRSDESGGTKQDDVEAGADGAHQAPAQIPYPTPRTVSMKSGASLAGRGCTSPQTRIMVTMQGCRRGIAGSAYISQHMQTNQGVTRRWQQMPRPKLAKLLRLAEMRPPRQIVWFLWRW